MGWHRTLFFVENQWLCLEESQLMFSFIIRMSREISSRLLFARELIKGQNRKKRIKVEKSFLTGLISNLVVVFLPLQQDCFYVSRQKRFPRTICFVPTFTRPSNKWYWMILRQMSLGHALPRAFSESSFVSFFVLNFLWIINFILR